jgi:hypothetical protein
MKRLAISIEDHESLVNVKDYHIEPCYWEHDWHHTCPSKTRKNYVLNIGEFVKTPEFRPTVFIKKLVDRSTSSLLDISVVQRPSLLVKHSLEFLAHPIHSEFKEGP